MRTESLNFGPASVAIACILVFMALMASLTGYLLNWQELIRVALIFFGIIVLYRRHIWSCLISDGKMSLSDSLSRSWKYVILFYVLTYAFLITQFDPFRYPNADWDTYKWLHVYGFAGLILFGCLLTLLRGRVRWLYWMSFGFATILMGLLLLNFSESMGHWLRSLECAILFLMFINLFDRNPHLLSSQHNYRFLKWVPISVILSLGFVLLLGMIRVVSLIQLYNKSESFRESRDMEQASDAYAVLHAGNAFLHWTSFTPESTIQRLSDIAMKSQMPRDGYLLGRVLMDTGRNEEAIQQFRTTESMVLKNEISDRKLLYNLFRYRANALATVQNWFELNTHAHSVEQYFPDDPIFWSYICISAAKTDDFESAGDVFAKILRLYSDGQDITAWILNHKGKVKFADLIPISNIYWDRLTLLEIVEMLQNSNLGLPIAYESEEIGNTGLVASFDIDLFSTPYNAGQPWLRINQGRPWVKVNGKDVFGGSYGSSYHLAVVNPQTGQVDTLRNFNTWMNRPDNQNMAQFIDQAPEGHVVVAVVNDEASANLTTEGVEALRRIGAKGNLRGHHRWAHLIAGVKGAAPGTALELMSRYAIRGAVLKDNLENVSAADSENPVLILSGKFPDYMIQVYDGSHPYSNSM